MLLDIQKAQETVLTKKVLYISHGFETNSWIYICSNEIQHN